ncbi:MAG: hypothetical protein P1P87_14475 [Trueperaceae bacterium]|nr:hypothetical protein [Trueperaceae bacterium]
MKPLAALLLCAAAIAAPTALAGGWLALDLPARLAATRDAFVARVRASDVEVRGGEPWTVVTLEVERWLRRDGRPAADGDPAEVRIAIWGGRAPGAAPLLVAGAPSFVPGERVLLLLRSGDAGLAVPIVGVDQGVWRERDGVWSGDDGGVLGLGVGGRAALGGDPVGDEVLFDALAEALDEAGGPR